MNTTERMPNRLINETSPYLLQHAYNPVDWYPWGDEAFDKAKAEEKPVFLSIGYSTCHWCHVMEEESFMDGEVADYLNRYFIPVKVDKEERPDVDAVYMTVCQALTGSGGWPTTILMTGEQKPFYAATYLPKNNRYGRMGLLELLAAVKKKWDTQRGELVDSGNKIADALSKNMSVGGSGQSPDKTAVERALKRLSKNYDEMYGGFGAPPKFPMPHHLTFLLRCHGLGISGRALRMAEHTLKQMYKGGIFDHIGFGFSRYSTDEKWLAPHFEKMLYDNALLAIAYLECHQITNSGFYREVAAKILEYTAREMTSPEGGFYSAQDADIGGKEGKFYTFARDEVREVLGRSDAELFCKKYDITKTGNFEGKNIPNLIAESGVYLPDDKMRGILDRLYQYRTSRFSLHKDDKILTAWNALMIAAHAKARRVLGGGEYLDRAVKALGFIETNLTGEDGELLISYRNGVAKGHGLLDDYAFLAWACLELYDAAFDIRYLEKARKLTDTILERFSCGDGGFYTSGRGGEELILKTRERYDGAMPSGNSVAAYCLSRLAALTGREEYHKAAARQLEFYSDMMANQPDACSFALSALMLEAYPTRELVCVLADEAGAETLSRELGARFLPQTAILVKTPQNAERLSALAPFTQSYPIPEGQGQAFYLCQNGACAPPVYDISELF